MKREHVRLMVPFYQREGWDEKQNEKRRIRDKIESAELMAKQKRLAKMTSTELISSGFMDSPRGKAGMAR